MVQNLCCQGRMVTLSWFQSWGHLGKRDEKRENLKKLGKKKS